MGKTVRPRLYSRVMSACTMPVDEGDIPLALRRRILEKWSTWTWTRRLWSRSRPGERSLPVACAVAMVLEVARSAELTHDLPT